tara:strand:+ start:507 stop:815 length:309 start_codon:yes stop_codon:yes gene_type:complete
MELEKIHLVRILTMPGGTSEILMRGEKNGTVTSLFLVDNVVRVQRIVEGVSHTRLVPLSNIQSMEEYGGKAKNKSKAGSSQRSAVEQGAAPTGRRGRPKKTG